MPSTAISRLLERLSDLEDPRQQAKVLYPLPEILLLNLASSLAGADDVVEMARWANLNADFLRRYYAYARGFPSHDTVSDVFNALDAQLFSELFIRWTNSLSAGAGDLLNIDGKTSRRSGGNGQNPRTGCQRGQINKIWCWGRKSCRTIIQAIALAFQGLWTTLRSLL